jgi:hypothetical protein
MSMVTTALLAVAVLAGCTAEAPTPTASTTSASAAATPTASPTATPSPTEPAFSADGSADDNLPVFTATVEEVWASDDRESGRAYIDALVTVGFDKSAMEVTEDYSTVGNRAESIQFAVMWGDECLAGQVGQATGDPVTTVLPALAEGTCLIGNTRDIDW